MRYLLLLFSFFSVNLVAQDISRTTVSSSGSNNVTENGYTILQSVGQLSLIGSFELRNVTIVQGYQQPYMLNLLNMSNSGENLKLFPIPVENELHILFSKSKEGICEVELFDRLGRIVLREWILIEDYKISINLQQFAAATYIIKISNQYSVFYESIIKL